MPRQSDSLLTRSRIVQAARALFLERTFLGVSMNDIAQAVGMTKGAVYHHFASKMDLLRAVITSLAEDQERDLTLSSAEPDAAHRLQRMVETYLSRGLGEERLIAMLGSPLHDGGAELRSLVEASRVRLTEIVAPALAELPTSGPRPSAEDCREAASLLIAMLDGLILSHHFLGEAVDPKAVAARVPILFQGSSAGVCG